MPPHYDDMDEKHMRRAVALGRLGVGFVAPNPPVGALVVQNAEVIGAGYHREYGRAHAEIEALQQATAERTRGATLYVTLEPCNHQGKTPPCTRAIHDAGIARVVYGVSDPCPEAGFGGAYLCERGVEVIGDVLEADCRRLCAAFLKHTVTGLPLVIAKWAMSLDGKIATRTGDSRWISNEESRHVAHALRADCDAVLIGVGTAAADDPQLNCRNEGHPEPEHFSAAEMPCEPRPPRQPKVVVIDPTLRLRPDARLLGSERDVFVLTRANVPDNAAKALEAQGAAIIAIPIPFPIEKQTARPNATWFAPRDILTVLGKRGIQSVLIEGGGKTLGAFLDAGLVDRAVVFVAPKLIGGDTAPTAAAETGVDAVADAIQLRDVTVRTIGDNVMIDGAIGDWNWGMNSQVE